jgi:hypothetical protein
MRLFRWQRGRQQSGYDKMLLIECYWPLPFDAYLLRYPPGSEVAPHIDESPLGRHFRLNLVIRHSSEGGTFQCNEPLFESSRVKFFRPDISMHSVSKVVSGTRYVLSVGWIRDYRRDRTLRH